MADPAIDLVDVVTPNNMHAEVALAALKARMGVAPAAVAQPQMQEQQSIEEIEKQIEAELAAKR